MGKKITLDNSEQFHWGDAGIGWMLSNRKDITIVERQLSSGAKEVSHYHKKSWQFFYVISGEGEMKIGDDTIILRANEAIEVDPMVAHQMKNSSEGYLRYIVISSPNSYNDRVEV